MAREGIDGVSRFFGIRWDDPETARISIRPELINAGGLLSGVATYALVDYTMGSALWKETAEDEAIATVNISINYVRRAAVCWAVILSAGGQLHPSKTVLQCRSAAGGSG